MIPGRTLGPNFEVLSRRREPFWEMTKYTVMFPQRPGRSV